MRTRDNEFRYVERGAVKHENIAIVGASLAGLNAARALRETGFEGRITLVGAEPHLPYDRPPLSKGSLTRSQPDDYLDLCEDGIVADDVTLELGRAAVALDLHARRLILEGGSTIAFTGLVLACGARARRLPDRLHLEGVHTLRDIDDARAIRTAFEGKPRRVVVVGAGFIGCEVATTARRYGLDVTLVEQLTAPCVRALGPVLGAALAELHRTNGVDLRLATGVRAIEGAGRVERVRLSDGSSLDVDVVVVGIGVVPNVEWLAESGLRLDDGIVCDATSLAAPGVTAAGDVARRPDGRHGGTMRVEHWDNAIAQGAVAGRRLLATDGEGEVFDPIPWFWSDQFDWNLQLAGHPAADDTVEAVTGNLGQPPFSAAYMRAGRATGFLGVNCAAAVRKARRLLAKRTSLDELRAMTAAAARL